MPSGFYCVVNNAGINAGGWIDMTSEDTFEILMNVNYMGVIRIIKALLPSLRTYAKSRHTLPNGQDLPRARLIGMSSVSGRINPIGLGPYAASKHAVESILDTLRVELSPWDIEVSMIEPGYAKTPIITKSTSAIEQQWSEADKQVQQMYGNKFIESLLRDQKTIYEMAVPAQWTVDATVNAIHKKNGAQKARILIGTWSQRFLVRVLEKLPEWTIDWIMRGGMKSSGHWAANPFLLKDAKQD